jgi:imidazolonepropionase-like amidohydrolase
MSNTPRSVTARFWLSAAAAITWMGGVVVVGALAQVPPPATIRPADPRAHAITNAKVIVKPGEVLENATIIMRDGVIELVGPSDQVQVPADVRIWPGDGLTVYPGLIEPALMIRQVDPPRSAGSHWNPRVHPELSMADQPAPDLALRKDLRGMGFTVAAVYPSTGAMRGRGVVLALAEVPEHVTAYSLGTSLPPMAMALDYGGFRRGGAPADPDQDEDDSAGYPGSLMGAIALIRQTMLDAQWHAACRRVWQANPSGEEPPIRADALQALGPVSDRTQMALFEVSDELNALRAAKLAREFNIDLVLLGSGLEFRRLNEIVALGLPIIVPLDFPKRPDVTTISQADAISLRDLQTWEQAPTNARRLVRAAPQNSIALTTHKLKSRNEFPAHLRTAIKHGLTDDEALAAMTTTPAKLLGLDSVLGTIEAGKAANLVVVKGALFDKDGKVRDTWINGRRYEISKEPDVKLVGAGAITVEGHPELKIDVNTEKQTVSITLPDEKTKVTAKKVVVQQDQLSWVTDARPVDAEGFIRYSGVIDLGTNTITGMAELPDGTMARFTATIAPKAEGEVEEKEGDQDKPEDGEENAHAQPQAAHAEGPGGMWAMRIEEMPDAAITLELTLEDDGATVTGTVTVMGQALPISNGKFDRSADKFTCNSPTPDGGTATIEASISGFSMTGTVTSAQFTGPFTASREGAPGSGSGDRKGRKGEAKEPPFEMPPDQLVFPLGEYGLTEPPESQRVIITGATIWTCGPDGVIENGMMIVDDGKIDYVGPMTELATTGGGFTIDAAGKHITPGLIDCHSHTGIAGGVNESTHSNTAEVRIGDVIDPDDIDWYRELAGGLTACNQLHGSANAIGGQNSVVKIKWGSPASAFPISDALPGIKFALGENVKRSTGRYPNTRMGVEMWIRDAFTAAREYEAEWDRYLAMPADKRATTMPPRRDLEMDALVEILDGKRIVHCHSYRQDEILMLIRVADDFGFTIGTFQHVLEGYKVADAIAAHGAGGSSFSDWWAYKMEAMDAIPHNGALMHDVGVLVSFNSDSDELARRMNWEAAKAVRYGGLAPEEALKFVTINPARQLRIDHRTGSLEQGKDADFVVWSEGPLSTYSRCEQTWIEGACHFSMKQVAAHREAIKRERERLIQKILTQAHGQPAKPGEEEKTAETQPDAGAETKPEGATDDQPRQRRRPPQFAAWVEEQLRLGIDPDSIRPGVCGCDE